MRTDFDERRGRDDEPTGSFIRKKDDLRRNAHNNAKRLKYFLHLGSQIYVTYFYQLSTEP